MVADDDTTSLPGQILKPNDSLAVQQVQRDPEHAANEKTRRTYRDHNDNDESRYRYYQNYLPSAHTSYPIHESLGNRPSR